MRVASLLPLAVTTGLLAGCGPEAPRVAEQEETTAAVASGSERDLTLPAVAAPAVELASPVELTRPAISPSHQPRPPIAPQPAPAPEPVHATERVTPATAARAAEHALGTAVLPAATLTSVAAQPAKEEPAEAAGAGRELAPGTTVTVIPAASGPAIDADPDDSWLPSERPRSIIGGGGGTCRPRGGVRGVGIAGRIPVGIPARRLR